MAWRVQAGGAALWRGAAFGSQELVFTFLLVSVLLRGLIWLEAPSSFANAKRSLWVSDGKWGCGMGAWATPTLPETAWPVGVSAAACSSHNNDTHPCQGHASFCF
eukprot:350732-Chlamydomonas_euryale.AAC.1